MIGYLRRNKCKLFPLIPLPIKEAVALEEAAEYRLAYEFPLIPLPIKEAVHSISRRSFLPDKFPLIPLPIKEAVLKLKKLLGSLLSFH